MRIIFNEGVSRDEATKEIDNLVKQANKINGQWEQDALFFDLNRNLQNNLINIFENSDEIIASLYSKGRYDNDILLDIKKIVTPNNYEQKRNERSKQNKTVFLQQLSVLLKLLEKLDKHTGKDKKIKITVSNINGIFRYVKNDKLTYGISGGRKRIIYFLKDGLKTGNILSTALKCDITQLSKEINAINKLFCKYLQVDDKLIIRAQSGGYILNDIFEIEFVEK